MGTRHPPIARASGNLNVPASAVANVHAGRPANVNENGPECGGKFLRV
jgi:hypothetical protein